MTTTQHADDDVVPTVDVLRWQADVCRASGSPTAATICDAVADDLASGGPTAALLQHETRWGDWVGLRVMGLVHRLAIDRRATPVALGCPTLGGTSPHEATDPLRAVAEFRDAVVAALADHPDELVEALARVPQTNEVGRTRLLRIALSRSTLPVRLFELGSSAGLHLRADHLDTGSDLEAGPLPDIVERRGCDLSPVDPSTTVGRTWLSGFVWVDDIARFAALGRAINVALDVPAEVVAMGADEFVRTLDLLDGTTTVVWHSAVWPYLAPDVRARILEALDALGAGATPTAPLWHVAWEPSSARSDEFELRRWVWDGSVPPGDGELIARGNPHGRDPQLVG